MPLNRFTIRCVRAAPRLGSGFAQVSSLVPAAPLSPPVPPGCGVGGGGGGGGFGVGFGVGTGVGGCGVGAGVGGPGVLAMGASGHVGASPVTWYHTSLRSLMSSFVTQSCTHSSRAVPLQCGHPPAFLRQALPRQDPQMRVGASCHHVIFSPH